MRRKVTIQSIADFTGLSKFAVSRALSGKPGVSSQTRDTIFKAAGQLGYFKDSKSAQNAGMSWLIWMPANGPAQFWFYFQTSATRTRNLCIGDRYLAVSLPD